MRKKFSDLAVERIKGDPAKRVEHSDALLPALRLCVFPSGARSWILRTRIGGRTVKLTIGNAAVLPVAEARAKARDALSRVERGEDPRLAAAEEAAARRLTLGGVVRDYLEHRAADRLKPRTLGEARRALEVLWSPLHHLPVARVPRARVASRLLEIKAERGPIAANRARAYLSGCFTWAVRQGLAEANPVAGTEAPGVERRRERVLDLEELRLIWRATEEPFGYHRVVRLLILLGARRDEVGAMAWGELSDDLATWVLPASRTKTGQSRELPLPTQVIGIITGTPRIAGQANLFGRNGFKAWSQSKAR